MISFYMPFCLGNYMDNGTRRKRQEERDPRSLGLVLLLFGTFGLAIEGFALYTIYDGNWDELAFSDYLFPGLTMFFIPLGLLLLISNRPEKEKESKIKMACFKCSHFNNEGSTHCTNCGQELTDFSQNT